MDSLKRQLRNLDIPYPQRHFLELEVCQDFKCVDDAAAVFSDEDLHELSEIHSTAVHRLLKRLDSRQRRIIETSTALIPLISVSILFTKEEVMTQFIREGGVSMYAILIIGIFLLGREILNMLRLLMIRDHSADNLRIDTSSVLLGCLALTFVGIGSMLVGLYSSVQYWESHSHLLDALIIGTKESLANAILSSLLCAVVMLAHYATRRILHIWRAPIAE